MAKRNKYRINKVSDFYDYSEGKLPEKERNAFERGMQRDSFESDAAEGFSRVSREEAMQDMQSVTAKIRKLIARENNRNTNKETRQDRNRRIAWYSAAAAIASLMIVTTIFFRLNDNGLESYETVPEMREAAKEQPAPFQEILVAPEEPEKEDVYELEKQSDELEKKQGKVTAEDVYEHPEPAGKVPKSQSGPSDKSVQKQAEPATKSAKDPGKAMKQTGPEDKSVQKQAEPVTKSAKDPGKAMKQTGPEDKSVQKQAEPVTKSAKDPGKAMADGLNEQEKKAEPSKKAMTRDAAFEPEQTPPRANVNQKDLVNGTVAVLDESFAINDGKIMQETLQTGFPRTEAEEVYAATDQQRESALTAEGISRDDVVLIWHCSQNQKDKTSAAGAEETITSKTGRFEGAAPVNGLADFMSYIDSALVYPVLTEEYGKEVVVLKFSVSPDGRPQNIQVILAPGNEAFEKEAIRVISQGPDWRPATLNGQYTEEDVRLIILFSKD